MNRLLLALLLVLAGCRRGADAVKVTVHVAPAVKANCITVEVFPTEASDSPLGTTTVVRPSSKEDLVLAVFQEKGWPKDIQVRARALVGSADCTGELVRNGHSEFFSAEFLKEREPTSVTVNLPPPTKDQDVDGDGFVNPAADGADCDDNEPLTHPGGREACDASADRNCNTKLGCDDEAACPAPSCSYVPAQLAFAVSSSEVRAGACAPVVVKRLDASGRPTAPGFVTPVTVTSDSPTEFHLYADATCLADLGPFSIPAGSEAATFYVRGIHVRAGQLKASSTQYGTASATYTVTPAPAKQLFLAASAGPSLKAAECSSAVTVRAQDEYLNPSPVTVDTVLSLTSTAGGAVAFFTDAACGSHTTQVTIPSGGTEASFYVKGLGGGAVTLTATTTSGALSPVSQSVNVASAVRRGTCAIDSNQGFVDCPLDPAVADVSKAFFIFQATSNLKDQDISSVRCYLLNVSTLRCARAKADPAAVTIAWQLVEMASGLRVYHFFGPCDATAPTTVFTLPAGAVVDMSKSFVLFSSFQEGKDADNNHYATAVLKSPTQVEVALNSADCSANNKYGVQVVQMEGLSVSRGTSTPGDSPYPFLVNIPASAPASRSLLLATYQASHPSGTSATNAICNRTVRGDVSGDTQLRLFRGYASCKPGLITTLAWERITAVANASVQSVSMVVNTGFTGDLQDLGTAVDPNRTVLLSSTQTHGGQSSGETTYAGDSQMSVADGRFQLKLVGSEYKRIEVTRDTKKGDSFWTVYALQFEP